MIIKYFLRKLTLDLYEFMANLLGNFIIFFSHKQKKELKYFNKIIFDARARIGDGVIIKPLIILFSKFINEELGLNIEIEVETCDYNNFVFNDENAQIYYKIRNFPNENDEHTTIQNYLRGWKNRYKIYKNKVKKIEKTLYVSANPDHVVNSGAEICIGNNLWLDNYLLDYCKSQRGKTHVVKMTLEILLGYFNIPDFHEYIEKNIDYFFADYNNSKDKSGILIFVGNKQFRNLSIECWHSLIKEIGKQNNNQIISIIDDNIKTTIDKLKKFNDYSENIVFIDNNFSLDEFRNFCKKFKLLVGVDGGGFNYVRTCSNSITIYTLARHGIWHIYTGDKKYKKYRLENNWFLSDIEINGKYFGYIYKRSPILPSTGDYSVGINYFDDLSTNKFVHKLNSLL